MRFRHLGQEAREDHVQEVIAYAMQAFLRLWEQGRSELAYAGPLARFGACRVLVGRHVGGRSNMRDLMSVHRRRHATFRITRLHEFDDLAGKWKEIVVEDGKASPSDIAAVRIDFSEWLNSLNRRERRIAQVLASGERTGAAARLFGITAGRVAQLRKELRDSWYRFQGENIPGVYQAANS